MKKICFLLLVVIAFSSCTKDDDEDVVYVAGEDVEDIDGNVYSTVVIGSQTWMAENLKATSYADGTEIPLVEDDDAWTDLGENNTDKGCCYYSSTDNSEYEDYGVLYTYAAAVNGTAYEGENIQGVCPNGWHLPCEEEWEELVEYAGGSLKAGASLKETGTSHWVRTESEVNNETGFTALPGGYRYLYDGSYDRVTSIGYFWTSTENTSADALVYWFHNTSVEAFSSFYGKSYGFSVRCLKDE